MDLLVWAGFRVHLLIPNTLVGTFQDDKPTFPGLELVGGVWHYQGKPVISISKRGAFPKTQVVVKAHRDLWIREAGLSCKLLSRDGVVWRGFGRNNRWTKTTSGVDGWLPLELRDAHRATVRWTRVRTSREYTTGVERRHGRERARFYSGMGFSRMLNEPPGVVPWQRCVIFSGPKTVQGTVPKTSGSPVRAWELAGHPASFWPGDPWPRDTPHPASDWQNFHGWGGGAGVVVQNVPPYRADQILHPNVPVDHLWDPVTFRLFKAGRSISQIVECRTL